MIEPNTEISETPTEPTSTSESELAQAIDLAYQARKSGGIGAGEKVSWFARQQSLFPFDTGETVADYTNATVLMLADCLNDGRVSRMKKVLAIYNDHAAQSAAGQYDIFSGGVKSKEEIINDVLNILNNGTETEQQTALAGAAERRKEAAGVSEDGFDATSVAAGKEIAESSNKTDETTLKTEILENNGEIDRPKTDRRDTGDRLRDAVPRGAQRGDSGVDIGSLAEGLAAERSGDRGRSQRADEEAVGHQIIENAKKSGVFIDRSTLNSFGERVRKPSGESVVYVDVANNRVVKVKDLYAKDNLKGHAASDALYEHIVHNLLFPNTQYRLIGISDDSIGDVRFVLEQDIIKDTTPATQQDIDWYLINELGLTKVEKPYLHYENDYYSITDVDASGDNVFVDDEGSICFIDPIIKFKRPAVEVINYLTTGNAIAAAEAEVDTNPTEGQKEAGNYKKGHLKLDGYDITIEQPKGSIRRGTDPNGRSWEQEMHNTYGYIRGTEGVDGDHIDVFLSDDPTSGDVFVVDQVTPKTGEFDEHKVMYGFPDTESARKAYLSNYEEGWQGLGAITPVSKEEFKKWIESSKHKMKPFSEYRSVETLGDVQLGKNQAEEYKAPAKEEGEDVIAYAQRVAETHKAYEEKQRHRQEIDDATARVADAVVSGEREAIEKASAELEKLTQTEDKKDGEKEQRLQEERKQRILSEGTSFDKPFALTPVSETMTPEEIGANVRRIVEGLKASEGDNGDFEGFAYNGNYKKNAGHQVDEYLVSLSGVVPDETLRQWYESEGLKTRDDLRAYGEELYSQKSARSQKGVEGRGVGKVTKALRDELVELMRSAGLDVMADEKEGQRTLDKFRELARLMGGGEMSERRRKRDEQNRTIDEATAIVTGKKVDDVRRERIESEEQRREKAKEVYKIILSGEYNDVSLQKISDFIEDVTPRNPYGRRLSERLPQRVERALYERTRENAVDALFSRASESAVPANERAGAAGKRAVAEKKKELLEQWAKATGNWHTDLKDFTDNTEAVSDDTTDSDVYLSNDGAHVIKLSRGKQDKRFGTDIDAVPLFNYVFPNSAYRILGYGDFGKGFVRVLEQPYVDFASSTPLTEAERVEYMARLGFKPIGKSTTAFSNGEIVVADLQGNNIVRDAAGNISVIDADCKLHTKDVGGSYKYLPVEHDLPSETLREMRAYHGSGADFDAFDHSHIGEGEGAQVYGWGTYVTEVEGIGRHYAKMMGKDRQSKPMQDKYYEISKNREQYLRKVWEFQHTKDVEERKRIKAEMERLSADNDRLWEEYHELEDKVNSVLYEVEIPDDNGSNYLEWDKPIGEENIGSLLVELEKHLLANDDYYKEQYKGHENDLIANLESDFKSTDEGRFVYENLAGRLGSDKAASEFLHSMGYVGIKYPAEYMSGGRSDGAKNYVVFDEGDLKITDKARLFRTEEGEVYGFTMGGKIYIDPSVATAETPIHEYTHLWTDALRKANPEAWERLKEEMRQQEGLMDYVRSKYPELTNEDELMEEVFAHYSGRRGAERLESDMREAMAQEPDLTLKAQVALVFHKLREVLQKFWSMARDLFAGKVEGLEGMTAEDFADMALGDLLRGVDPMKEAEAANMRMREQRREKWNNGGYTTREDGTRVSVRGKRAEEEGRYPRGTFMRKNRMGAGTFELLRQLGAVGSGEWHHTGKALAKTPYYGWRGDEADAAAYAGHQDCGSGECRRADRIGHTLYSGGK